MGDFQSVFQFGGVDATLFDQAAHYREPRPRPPPGSADPGGLECVYMEAGVYVRGGKWLTGSLFLGGKVEDCDGRLTAHVSSASGGGVPLPGDGSASAVRDNATGEWSSNLTGSYLGLTMIISSSIEPEFAPKHTYGAALLYDAMPHNDAIGFGAYVGGGGTVRHPRLSDAQLDAALSSEMGGANSTSKVETWLSSPPNASHLTHEFHAHAPDSLAPSLLMLGAFDHSSHRATFDSLAPTLLPHAFHGVHHDAADSLAPTLLPHAFHGGHHDAVDSLAPTLLPHTFHGGGHDAADSLASVV